MKICISTIHNVSNYGAVLQTFALKASLGEENEIRVLDVDNPYVSDSLKLIRFGPISLHRILAIGKDIFRLWPRKKAISKFNKFINERFELIAEDKAAQINWDLLISGSDQIWNPACVSPKRQFVDEYFFLGFPKQIKRVSYASSFGAYKFNEIESNELAKRLARYESISLRETSSAQWLSEQLDRQVDTVVDPTLLLSMSQWRSLLPQARARRGLPSKYIFVYYIKKTPLFIKTVSILKKILGLPVIAINQGLFFSRDINYHLRDAGPEEFVSLVDGASFVLTDSFHGVCFSLIFGKKFVAISPGENVNRISSLLSQVGLESRVLEDGGKAKEKCIDVLGVGAKGTDLHERLDDMRKKSLAYLELITGRVYQ